MMLAQISFRHESGIFNELKSLAGRNKNFAIFSLCRRCPTFNAIFHQFCFKTVPQTCFGVKEALKEIALENDT
jgi:hypothetical protein